MILSETKNMHMQKRSKYLCFNIVLLILITQIAFATEDWVKCPSQFSDSMVLQRDKSVPVWGWTSPNEKIVVQFAGQEKRTVSDPSGQWKIVLDKMQASQENRELVISSGEKKKVFKNVMVGEVWIASGQSNMQWTLPRSNMPKEVLAKLNEPLVRIITLRRATSASPRLNFDAKWQTLNSVSGPGSSAVASFFAIKLKNELNVPIGMISTSWGGTRIEPWTPAEGFDKIKELKHMGDEVRNMDQPDHVKISQVKDRIETLNNWLSTAETSSKIGKKVMPVPEAPSINKKISNRSPGAIYNSMIHPLVGTAIRGAIWYQGESNMGEGMLYEKKMQALVKGWREIWYQGEFPFYYVQLAPFGRYSGEKLGGLWEAQMMAMKSIPNSGMAVTTDIGNLRDIHPKDKEGVGNRLALWALAKDYGKKVVYSGPIYSSHEILNDKMIISFQYAESGLAFKGKALKDIYVKSATDKEYVLAETSIDGSKLIVSHPKGEKPTSVRMGWNKNAEPNLMNKEGLPASPFRTK